MILKLIFFASSVQKYTDLNALTWSKGLRPCLKHLLGLQQECPRGRIPFKLRPVPLRSGAPSRGRFRLTEILREKMRGRLGLPMRLFSVNAGGEGRVGWGG